MRPPKKPVFSTLVASALKAGALAAVALAPVAFAAAQAPDHAPLPPGQVWQCVHDGLKIFSDAPCGSGATIRQLNDLNVMDPAPENRAPPYPSRMSYAPPASYPRDAPPPVDDPSQRVDYANSAAADPVYVTQQVIGVNAVRRAGRPARPWPHDHPFDRGHAARVAPAPPAARGPATPTAAARPTAAAPVAHAATSHAVTH